MKKAFRRVGGLMSLLIGLSALWIIWAEGVLNLPKEPIRYPSFILFVIWLVAAVLAHFEMIFDFQKPPISGVAVISWVTMIVVGSLQPALKDIKIDPSLVPSAAVLFIVWLVVLVIDLAAFYDRSAVQPQQ